MTGIRALFHKGNSAEQYNSTILLYIFWLAYFFKWLSAVLFLHVAKFTYNEIPILCVHSVSSSKSANTCVQTLVKTYNIVTPKHRLFWVSTPVFLIWGLHINGVTCSSFVCKTSSAQHPVFIYHSHRMYQQSFPFYCRVVFRYKSILQFGVFVSFFLVFPLWILCLLSVFPIDGYLVISRFCPNEVAESILVQVFLRIHVFISLE